MSEVSSDKSIPVLLPRRRHHVRPSTEPTFQGTTVAGGHLRKLGIRLNSATKLERKRLNTAVGNRHRLDEVECEDSEQCVKLHQRLKAQSAPLIRTRSQPHFISNNLPTSSHVIKNSLALYSPQSQRINTEQLSDREKVLLRISNANRKPHREDKRFYVSGANFSMLNRYHIDKEQHKLLHEFLEKRNETRFNDQET